MTLSAFLVTAAGWNLVLEQNHRFSYQIIDFQSTLDIPNGWILFFCAIPDMELAFRDLYGHVRGIWWKTAGEKPEIWIFHNFGLDFGRKSVNVLLPEWILYFYHGCGCLNFVLNAMGRCAFEFWATRLVQIRHSSKSRKALTKTIWKSHSGIPPRIISIFLRHVGTWSWVCTT